MHAPSSSASSSSTSASGSSSSSISRECSSELSGENSAAPAELMMLTHPYLLVAIRWFMRMVFPNEATLAKLTADKKATARDSDRCPLSIVLRERRYKFALLSITLLLCSVYYLLLLVLFCPGIEFTPVDPDSDSKANDSSHSSLVFIKTIVTLLAGSLAIFAIHHYTSNITMSAYLVLFYMNCSWWAVCILWGPISEFLASLVHVPVLAFSVLGHRAGVRSLVLLLGESVVYIVLCFIGIVPTSGNTLKLSVTASISSIVCSYVLLGLCAGIDERARSLAVSLYEEAHSQLAKSTRAKTRYLASVSHGTCPPSDAHNQADQASADLRSPLHGVIAASKELASYLDVERCQHSDAVIELCAVMTESSEHMLSLINDLLDFEKMENNQMKIERTLFDVRDEMKKIIKMVTPQAKQKLIEMPYRIDLRSTRRIGDPLRFRQLLTNFVTNAVKFTPECGRISINATTGEPALAVDDSDNVTIENSYEEDFSGDSGNDMTDEDIVTVAVSDTGIGLEAEDLPLLFKSFTQVDASTTRKFGGSGLGLAICKRLCQLMQGRIGCHSQKDHGSTFWFSLPLPCAKDEQWPSPAMLKASLSADDSRAMAGQQLPPGLKVLLVEDSAVSQKVGKHMLAQLGAAVVIAKNGEQGLRIWEQDHFDIILMDYHMPIMDGREASRRIRQREKELKLPRTPIIALSGLNENECQWIAAGMDYWLVKPFDRDRLRTAILRCLQEMADEHLGEASAGEGKDRTNEGA